MRLTFSQPTYSAAYKSMPYEIIWEPRGVVQRFQGHISMADLERANDEMYGDHRFDSIKYGIVDALQVSEIDLTRADSTATAYTDNVVSSYTKPIRLALVATLPALCELMDHYLVTLAALNSVWTLKRFATMEEAREWVMG